MTGSAARTDTCRSDVGTRRGVEEETDVDDDDVDAAADEEVRGMIGVLKASALSMRVAMC